MPAPNSIYNQLRPMFLLVLSALIPVILLGGVVGQYFIQQQRYALDQVIEGRASALSLSLSRELETQIDLLTILAESPRLDPPAALPEFAEIARRLQTRIPTWNALRLSDLDGRVLLSVPGIPPGAEARVVDMASYEVLLKTGKPSIGNLVKGPMGAYAFPVRVPVLRQAKTAYILSAVIRPGSVTDILAANGLPATWTAWVIDSKGTLVAASPASPAGAPMTSFASFDKTEAGETKSGTTASGSAVRIADAPVSGSSWTVYVGMPLAEYDALSWKGYLLVGITALVTLLLSGAAIYLFQKEYAGRRQQEVAFENSQRLQALGKLTGQVSHDFNNLLMVFQAGTNAIRRRLGQEDERVAQILDSMIDGVSRGKEMTQRLLSFSRRSDHGAKVLDPVQVLREFDPLLRQAANDSILVDYDIDPRLWPVTADPKALEIAMINLVTNAREAMPNGGKVTIRGSNVEDVSRELRGFSGSFIRIVVADTGTGIKPVQAARAFDPLFTTKGPGATGLGLTQVLTFAERSGGTARISSAQGIGTAVSIYLPRADAKVEIEALSGDRQILPKRILIVDDTPSSLHSARLSLEGEPVEVVTATNGAEALNLLQGSDAIDALLSDIMMPEMSGIELALQVKRDRPWMTIVLMTGFSDQIEQGLKVDFPVLMKPFSRTELLAALATQPSAEAKVAAGA